MIYLWSILLLSGMLTGLAGLLVLAERTLLNYGPCTIEVIGTERRIEVPGGGSLISALAQTGIHVPSLCAGQGTCGYCRVRVLSGGGPVLPTELLHLSEEEIRAGVRLACQLKVHEDIRLELPGAFLRALEYQARVCSVLELTPSVKEIRLRLEEPERIVFLPGQYIQVEVPVGRDEALYRAYSIASPVYETAEVALNVQRVPGGVGSGFLHRAAVGDVVHFTGPYGEFQISDDPEVEVVCVAGGCGLAPMKSIIYAVLAEHPGRRCRLFYGCRQVEEAYGLQTYRRLEKEHPGFQFVSAISQPGKVPADWPGETGPIHEALEKHLEPGVPRQAFVCGPPAMLEAVTEVLRRKGAEEVTFDEF